MQRAPEIQGIAKISEKLISQELMVRLKNRAENAKKIRGSNDPPWQKYSDDD